MGTSNISADSSVGDAVSDETKNTAPVSDSRVQALALTAVCLGFFMILLDGSALNIALPAIERDIGGSIAALQWLVNIYTIPLASLLLTAGVLADRVGSRSVFLWSLGGFTAASLLCAISPNLGVLAAFRCLQGIAAAGLLPTTLAIIARTYPDPIVRAKAITIWGATGGIALVAGPIGGGLLTEFIGWRSIFFVNVPIGVLALWLCWRHVRETATRDAESYDVPGQVLGIAGLALLVAGLIEGGSRGWGDPLALALLLGCVPALVGFFVVEGRTRHPVLPLSIFRKPAFSASIANGFAFQFGAYGMQFMLAIFIQSYWGSSALRTGLFFLPFAVLWTFGTLVLNRVWAGRGMCWLLTVGASTAAIGALLCTAIGDSDTWPVVMAGTALVGLGCGVFGPSCNGAAMAVIDKSFAGLASGVLNTSRQTGMAIGVAVLGIALSASNSVGGARIGMIFVAACFVAIVALSRRYLTQI
jgi:DHA2 family methylenomycin A resistance protein-like MFS transporter